MVAVIGLVAVALVRGLFTFLQGYLAERASQGVAYDLRDALFAQHRAPELQLLRPRADGPAADAPDQRRGAGAHVRRHGVIQLVASLMMLVGSAVLLLHDQLPRWPSWRC